MTDATNESKLPVKCCNWCGAEYTQPARSNNSKLFCSPGCKTAHNNFMGVVGKRIAATAMKWRLARGGSQNGGADALKELCFLLDKANAEFVAARPKGAPSIHKYYAARNAAPGARVARDI
jgi:hypothetical protein